MIAPRLDPAVAALLEAALAGGTALMPFFAAGAEARSKDDGSPVTLADEAAEAAILTVLERTLPGFPVVAEEACAAGRVPNAARRFLLVDPLDGTKEFVSGSGEFTVNVALVEDGRAVAGIVLAPAIGRIFLGSHDAGAFEARIGYAGPHNFAPIATRPAPREGLVAVASRSHAGAETDAFLSRLPVTARVSTGSSLKFCLVATGEADVYPRLGRTMEWDTAAGQAVLEAAGGCVLTRDGAPLRYGKAEQTDDSPYANPWFVAWGRKETVDAAEDEPIAHQAAQAG